MHFIKMNGLGNDFVIFDARDQKTTIRPEHFPKIADRTSGVGCDQIIFLTNTPGAHIFMHIFNADGSQSGMCGNAARCVAWLLFKETRAKHFVIKTISRTIEADVVDQNHITINMGKPQLLWKEIPLRIESNTSNLDLYYNDHLKNPFAVNVGNPHIVFFVDDFKNINFQVDGPALEKNPLFPEGANISFVKRLNLREMQLVVWERGAGLTKACGSAACAATVATILRFKSNPMMHVHFEKGTLTTEWQQGQDILMTGPCELNFTGILDQSMLEPL